MVDLTKFAGLTPNQIRQQFTPEEIQQAAQATEPEQPSLMGRIGAMSMGAPQPAPSMRDFSDLGRPIDVGGRPDSAMGTRAQAAVIRQRMQLGRVQDEMDLKQNMFGLQTAQLMQKMREQLDAA